MAFLCNWFLKITGILPYIIVFRPKYYFEDKRVQSRRIKGRAIVISNHTSVYDFAVTLFTFPSRTLRCASAELLYRKNIFMSLFLKMMGTVKVDRDSHDFSFIGKFKKLLDKNSVVEIYPESRLPEKNEPRPLEFKTSAVYLALETGAPIIPICNNGAIFSNRRMRVMVGKPVNVRDLYDESLSERENIKQINEYLRGKIIEFSKELEQKEENENRK